MGRDHRHGLGNMAGGQMSALRGLVGGMVSLAAFGVLVYAWSHNLVSGYLPFFICLALVAWPVCQLIDELTKGTS